MANTSSFTRPLGAGGDEQSKPTEKFVTASNFVGTLVANVDNKGLDDCAFRQFVRNSLPLVDYEGGVN